MKMLRCVDFFIHWTGLHKILQKKDYKETKYICIKRIKMYFLGKLVNIPFTDLLYLGSVQPIKEYVTLVE